jgi:hypothetical protein
LVVSNQPALIAIQFRRWNLKLSDEGLVKVPAHLNETSAAATLQCSDRMNAPV